MQYCYQLLSVLSRLYQLPIRCSYYHSQSHFTFTVSIITEMLFSQPSVQFAGTEIRDANKY